MIATDQPKPNAINTILTAGIVAGILDASAACIQYYIATGKSPVIVWNFVASGALGKEALSAGIPVAVAGLLFHFLIATLFAAFFFVIYPKIKILSKNIYLSGLVYGILVWMVMNLVVVPLSRIGPRPFVLKNVVIGMLIIMFCIGLPIALIVQKKYRSVAAN